MRKTGGLVGLAVALSLGAQGAHAAGCDLMLNVTDPDPVGLNVRAGPDGQVVGVLNSTGGLVQVHVTGQTGSWLSIDKAVFVPSGPGADRTLFSGHGYVALSKVGVEELAPQGDVLAAPQDGARRVWKVPAGGGVGPAAAVLGCSGLYIEVRVNGLTGWTEAYTLSGAPPP